MFVESYNPGQDDILQPATKSNIFTSRDLDTLYSNKKKVKVALFLPMSGKNANLGKLLYNSALISLFDNDKNNNIELVLVDSTDDPIQISQIFKQQIVKKGIKTVIGPIFSDQINIISRNAQRYNINVISLSNNQQLMGQIDSNSAIFIAGFLPEQQIDSALAYLQKNNINDVAVMAPNNSYGIAISKIIKDTIANRDATLIQSDLYDKSNNLENVVDRLVKAYKVPSSLTEGGGRKFEDDFRISKEDKRYAKAIIVTDSVKQLSEISNLVKKYNENERPIMLVGVGSWDDKSIKKEDFPTKIIFAAPNDRNFEKFEKSFYRYYKKLPPRISSIVYDSVSAIAQIVDRNGNRIPSTDDFINYQDTQINQIGFSGIDGNFRFLDNGLVQRQYSILELKDGQFIEINPSNERILNY